MAKFITTTLRVFYNNTHVLLFCKTRVGLKKCINYVKQIFQTMSIKIKLLFKIMNT